MRDETIQNMQEINIKRSMVLLKQYEFINARNMAYEALLSTRRGMLKAFFMPQAFRRDVDNMHRRFLATAEKQFADAMKKPVVKPIVLAGVPRG